MIKTRQKADDVLAVKLIIFYDPNFDVRSNSNVKYFHFYASLVLNLIPVNGVLKNDVLFILNKRNWLANY